MLFIILLSGFAYAESDIDQWKESKKTYRDLIDEGFEVKAYDTNTIKLDGNLIMLLFVTVLQKEKEVFECQEYQTLDNNLQTLQMSFVCKKIVQPFKIGITS